MATFSIVSILRIIGMVVLIFCSMMGAFGAQFKAKGGGTHLFLYKYTSGGTTRYYSDLSFGCGDIDRNFDASFTFAILAWVVILVGTVVAVVAIFSSSIPSIVNVILAGAAWCFVLLSWALVAALYNEGYCGGSGYEGSFKYDYGFAFLVITWICTMFWGAFELLIFFGVMPANGKTVSTSSTTAA